MKKFFLLFLVTLTLFLVACSASSGTKETDPSIPSFTTSTGWWIDTTGSVSDETMEALKQESNLAAKDGFQIAGAIFNDCVSDEVIFANKVGDQNGIGSSDKDNGIVFAVFLQKENSNGESPVLAIATGKGIEGTLNDAKVGRFIKQYFAPERKAGNWEKGLVNTLQAIHRYLQQPSAEEFKDVNKNEDASWVLWLILGVIAFFVVLGIIAGVKGGSSDNDSSIFGGGGFGGGGGIGGGGGFGGGGASG